MTFGKLAALALVLAPAPALAQMRPDFLPQGLSVQGSATIRTPPDIATIKIALRGEGKTPDAASADLAARQKAVLAALIGLDPKLTYTTGSVAIDEVRRGDCADAVGLDPAARLAAEADALADSASGSADTAKGPCRITGYVAAIEATVDLSQIDRAGTAVGLAGRQGAAAASLDGFGLRDPAAAQRAAIAAAIADAKGRATTLAAASGATLGPIVTIVSGNDTPTPMVAEKMTAMDVAPAVMPAPVVIDVAPRPVETTAQIFIVYSLTK